MLGFFRNLWHKPQETAREQQETRSANPSSSGPAVPTHRPAPTNASGVRPAGGTAPVTRAGRGVEVSVKAILEVLPLELQPRICQKEVGQMAICIPLEKVLAQLSRGAVRIGRTLCINPGSMYEQGRLFGAVVSLKPDRVENYVLTTG